MYSFVFSGGEDYQFTNEEDAIIFKSYEFELWDTQNNTEYKIPDGEYISVTVPVKGRLIHIRLNTFLIMAARRPSFQAWMVPQ